MSALRFVDSGAGPPAWNLALDEALWRSFADTPVLRVYGWKPAALTLGRFQRHDATCAAIPLPAETPVLRRTTGGGAIYHHDGELTYSVVVDLHAAGLPVDVRGSYAALHGMVARALERFGVGTAERGDADAHADDAHALCFERRMPIDLLVAGRKVCGSAQRRRGALLLQQGSILLTANPLVPGAISVADCAAMPVARADCALALCEEATVLLDRAAIATPPTDAELSLAAAIRADRYGSETWTRRVP